MDEPLPKNGPPENEGQKPSIEKLSEVKAHLPVEEETPSSLQRDLGLFWRAFLRYKYAILATTLAITIAAFVHSKMQIPLYYTQARVLVEPPQAPAENIVEFQKGGAAWDEEVSLFTEKDLIQSRVVAERVVKNLALDKIPAFEDSPDPIGGVLQMIKVEVSQRSRVISIGAQSPDPVLATKVANGVVSAYITVSDEKGGAWIEKTLGQMRGEIKSLKDRLRVDQQKLKQYEAEHPKVSSREALGGQLKSMNDDLVAVSSERLKLRTELEELAAFQKQGYDVRDHPSIAKEPSVEQIVSSIQQSRVALTQLLKIYKERFPLVLEKKAELVQLQEILGERKREVIEDVKSKYVLLGAREFELRRAIESKSAELAALLEESAAYDALLGDVEISKNLHILMMERMNKAGIIGRAPQTNVKVVSPALLPGSPVWPKTGRNVIFTFLVSLAGASYLAFLFFLMFKPIESEEEITRDIRIPVLTQIPRIATDESGRSPLILDQGEGFGKDALHVLRAALVVDGQHTILFTSARPSEGKTFLVHNTGVFLAREGWRVLLIGADFRDLHLRKQMNIDINGASLEAYVEGKKTEQEIIHPSSEPRLFFAGTAKAMKNSLQLITSPKFKEFISHVSAEYDFVLLDSPPVGLFPDAMMLANMVKGVILIIRSGETPLQTVLKVTERLKKSGTRIMGSILNCKTLGWQNYYYYHYYYGYGKGKGARQALLQDTFHRLSQYADRAREFVERRLHLRHTTALPVKLTLTLPQGKKLHFWGIATDLNKEGLRVEYHEADQASSFDFDELKSLDLEIKLSDKDKLFGKGEVVWKSRKKEVIYLGIKFCELADSDQQKIEQFLRGLV